MTNLIGYYEAVAQASTAMVEAARLGDWDGMVAAEAECAERVAALRAASLRITLAPADRARKTKLIHEVLRHDAEIRDLAMPWMAKLQELIGNSTRERRVSDAYGA